MEPPGQASHHLATSAGARKQRRRADFFMKTYRNCSTSHEIHPNRPRVMVLEARSEVVMAGPLPGVASIECTGNRNFDVDPKDTALVPCHESKMFWLLASCSRGLDRYAVGFPRGRWPCGWPLLRPELGAFGHGGLRAAAGRLPQGRPHHRAQPEPPLRLIGPL